MKKAELEQMPINMVGKKVMTEETRTARGRQDIKALGQKKTSKKYDAALRAEDKADTPAKQAHIVKLLEDAHEAGDRRATYALGTWYFHGRFFKKSQKEGFSLMLLAADDFVPEACFDVAVSYETGKGIKKDKEKAAVYYLRAMMLGERQSIEQVGRLFYWGIGVPKSRAIASELLNFINQEKK